MSHPTDVPEIPHRTETLVVGAGPSGLALAAGLARYGRPALVVDQHQAGANTSRAAVVHARTLEELEELDVVPRLVAEGLRVPSFTVRVRRRVLARVRFTGLPGRYPYALMIPQHRTEAVLEQRLTELGGAVRRGVRVTGLRPGPGGVLVDLQGPDGSTSQVRAARVIGADGMHSTVRRHSGIAFRGGQYPQTFVLADVRLDWPLPPHEVQLFFSPQGMAVVAPLPDGHHRVVAALDPTALDPDLSTVQRVLDERGPGGARVRELTWSSHFKVHHRVAERLRQGRVVLIGDAAHVHSPAGGQGMNTGIRDAVALARTLRDLDDGPEADHALDRYAAGRLAVAREVVATTDRMTRMATVRSPLARSARNAVLGLAVRAPRVERAIALRLAGLHVRR